jgi:thiamine pyrophosphate-dependent acetolactate synthase large subunit-like protein
MIKKQAITEICSKNKNTIIISANGFISRDLFEACDKTNNFYMIGSMGLASSIGLGIALKHPNKKIFVFDGDGNILMNLGSLVTIGFLKPKNLVHFIFDNSSHQSTGGQPTMTTKIELEKIAKAVNYKIFKINSLIELKTLSPKLKKISGPILVLVKVKNNTQISKRVIYPPEEIKKRFINSIMIK